MRSNSIVQLGLLVLVLLAATSEGFFFEYPKKAILEFFQSLKEKKDAKKKPLVNNIKHYHVHYYPQQIRVVKAPDNYELDVAHRGNLHSLGWADYGYKYVQEPRLSISSLFESWKQVHGPWSWGRGSLEADVSKPKDQTENQGILVRIPIQQDIILQQPNSQQHLRTSLLATFFQKLGSTQATDAFATT